MDPIDIERRLFSELLGAADGLDKMQGKGRPWRAHSKHAELSEDDPVRLYLRAYARWLRFRERSEH